MVGVPFSKYSQWECYICILYSCSIIKKVKWHCTNCINFLVKCLFFVSSVHFQWWAGCRYGSKIGFMPALSNMCISMAFCKKMLFCSILPVKCLKFKINGLTLFLLGGGHFVPVVSSKLSPPLGITWGLMTFTLYISCILVEFGVHISFGLEYM